MKQFNISALNEKLQKSQSIINFLKNAQFEEAILKYHKKQYGESNHKSPVDKELEQSIKEASAILPEIYQNANDCCAKIKNNVMAKEPADVVQEELEKIKNNSQPKVDQTTITENVQEKLEAVKKQIKVKLDLVKKNIEAVKHIE